MLSADNNNYEYVDHPSHYKAGGLEAIDVIDAWGLGFSLGSAVKYICRAGSKPGESATKDLRKAVWYINHEIERIEIEKELNSNAES